MTCPACGVSGELRGTEEHFEPRGQWPDGHYPVRRCKACGAGIIVRPRFLLFGARPQLIPDETWSKMDREFQRAVHGVDPDKPFPCSRCRKRFSTETALIAHRRDAHQLDD
jgi:hypothetical protein